ncbi:hypothetical protein BESB_045180 [Besnoitia besnoiti]|uniref:mitogen-activated protein kinase kinase n=1 Tax=Besnoitia besnoiti TaxID=94643 RepID=A0A2A9MK27_BESBE|nr:hypothetical protein BESB_045180 [Besnoitia besnoiti]PFH36326.1 hypothetical protein BESB_045180 [Besnoitia besnoiti]
MNRCRPPPLVMHPGTTSSSPYSSEDFRCGTTSSFSSPTGVRGFSAGDLAQSSGSNPSPHPLQTSQSSGVDSAETSGWSGASTHNIQWPGAPTPTAAARLSFSPLPSPAPLLQPASGASSTQGPGSGAAQAREARVLPSTHPQASRTAAASLAVATSSSQRTPRPRQSPGSRGSQERESSFALEEASRRALTSSSHGSLPRVRTDTPPRASGFVTGGSLREFSCGFEGEDAHARSGGGAAGAAEFRTPNDLQVAQSQGARVSPRGPFAGLCSPPSDLRSALDAAALSSSAVEQSGGVAKPRCAPVAPALPCPRTGSSPPSRDASSLRRRSSLEERAEAPCAASPSRSPSVPELSPPACSEAFTKLYGNSTSRPTHATCPPGVSCRRSPQPSQPPPSFFSAAESCPRRASQLRVPSAFSLWRGLPDFRQLPPPEASPDGARPSLFLGGEASSLAPPSSFFMSHRAFKKASYRLSAVALDGVQLNPQSDVRDEEGSHSHPRESQACPEKQPAPRPASSSFSSPSLLSFAGLDPPPERQSRVTHSRFDAFSSGDRGALRATPPQPEEGHGRGARKEEGDDGERKAARFQPLRHRSVSVPEAFARSPCASLSASTRLRTESSPRQGADTPEDGGGQPRRADAERKRGHGACDCGRAEGLVAEGTRMAGAASDADSRERRGGDPLAGAPDPRKEPSRRYEGERLDLERGGDSQQFDLGARGKFSECREEPEESESSTRASGTGSHREHPEASMGAEASLGEEGREKGADGDTQGARREPTCLPPRRLTHEDLDWSRSRDIGRGRSAHVYVVPHKVSDTRVAVKEVHVGCFDLYRGLDEVTKRNRYQLACEVKAHRLISYCSDVAALAFRPPSAPSRSAPLESPALAVPLALASSSSAADPGRLALSTPGGACTPPPPSSESPADKPLASPARQEALRPPSSASSPVSAPSAPESLPAASPSPSSLYSGGGGDPPPAPGGISPPVRLSSLCFLPSSDSLSPSHPSKPLLSSSSFSSSLLPLTPSTMPSPHLLPPTPLQSTQVGALSPGVSSFSASSSIPYASSSPFAVSSSPHSGALAAPAAAPAAPSAFPSPVGVGSAASPATLASSAAARRRQSASTERASAVQPFALAAPPLLASAPPLPGGACDASWLRDDAPAAVSTPTPQSPALTCASLPPGTQPRPPGAPCSQSEAAAPPPHSAQIPGAPVLPWRSSCSPSASRDSEALPPAAAQEALARSPSLSPALPVCSASPAAAPRASPLSGALPCFLLPFLGAYRWKSKRGGCVHVALEYMDYGTLSDLLKTLKRLRESFVAGKTSRRALAGFAPGFRADARRKKDEDRAAQEKKREDSRRCPEEPRDDEGCETDSPKSVIAHAKSQRDAGGVAGAPVRVAMHQTERNQERKDTGAVAGGGAAGRELQGRRRESGGSQDVQGEMGECARRAEGERAQAAAAPAQHKANERMALLIPPCHPSPSSASARPRAAEGMQAESSRHGSGAEESLGDGPRGSAKREGEADACVPRWMTREWCEARQKEWEKRKRKKQRRTDLLFSERRAAQENSAGVPESILKLIAFQILEGLAFLHQHRCLHRDIKPQNILVNKEGIVKVGDFGISRFVDLEKQEALTFVGTELYMSPERLHQHFGSAHASSSRRRARGQSSHSLQPSSTPYPLYSFSPPAAPTASASSASSSAPVLQALPADVKASPPLRGDSGAARGESLPLLPVQRPPRASEGGVLASAARAEDSEQAEAAPRGSCQSDAHAKGRSENGDNPRASPSAWIAGASAPARGDSGRRGTEEKRQAAPDDAGGASARDQTRAETPRVASSLAANETLASPALPFGGGEEAKGELRSSPRDRRVRGKQDGKEKKRKKVERSKKRELFAAMEEDEQHTGTYSFPSDIWSVGILLFELATMQHPFPDGLPCDLRDSHILSLLQTHLRGTQHRRRRSYEFRDFLFSCLRVKPGKRASADSLLLHPWLLEGMASRKHFKKWIAQVYRRAPSLQHFVTPGLGAGGVRSRLQEDGEKKVENRLQKAAKTGDATARERGELGQGEEGRREALTDTGDLGAPAETLEARGNAAMQRGATEGNAGAVDESSGAHTGGDTKGPHASERTASEGERTASEGERTETEAERRIEDTGGSGSDADARRPTKIEARGRISFSAFVQYVPSGESSCSECSSPRSRASSSSVSSSSSETSFASSPATSFTSSPATSFASLPFPLEAPSLPAAAPEAPRGLAADGSRSSEAPFASPAFSVASSFWSSSSAASFPAQVVAESARGVGERGVGRRVETRRGSQPERFEGLTNEAERHLLHRCVRRDAPDFVFSLTPRGVSQLVGRTGELWNGEARDELPRETKEQRFLRAPCGDRRREEASSSSSCAPSPLLPFEGDLQEQLKRYFSSFAPPAAPYRRDPREEPPASAWAGPSAREIFEGRLASLPVFAGSPARASSPFVSPFSAPSVSPSPLPPVFPSIRGSASASAAATRAPPSPFASRHCSHDPRFVSPLAFPSPVSMGTLSSGRSLLATSPVHHPGFRDFAPSPVRGAAELGGERESSRTL